MEMTCQKCVIGNGSSKKLKMKALTILVFNCGSSSLKFSFFCLESSIFDDSTSVVSPTESILNETANPETFQLKTLCHGALELSESAAMFYVKDAANKTLISEKNHVQCHVDAALRIMQFLTGFSTPIPDVIAHRVVHGGQHLQQHCVITAQVMAQLKSSAHFAPLHNLAALSVIEFTKKQWPQLPQVACFDTGFHHAMPNVAKQLALPKALYLEGIMRYGFHGLSCESILQQCNEAQAPSMPERLIITHLGAGASVSAIKNGQSMDTSMSLTPSGGVMMGTRSGDLDPSVLIYLMREKQMDADALENLVNHESGMLGVSGMSHDMRILHASAENHPDAQLAIDMFCYAVAKQIAAMMAVLNGVDTLVFTGGIGENDDRVRAAICQQLSFLDIHLDDNANQHCAHTQNNINTISDAKSRCIVQVIHTNENAQIARHAWRLVVL
jgi:acetate kinase